MSYTDFDIVGFEYVIERIDRRSYDPVRSYQGLLNKFGEEGWELVQVVESDTQPYVVFKRPKFKGFKKDE